MGVVVENPEAGWSGRERTRLRVLAALDGAADGHGRPLIRSVAGSMRSNSSEGPSVSAHTDPRQKTICEAATLIDAITLSVAGLIRCTYAVQTRPRPGLP